MMKPKAIILTLAFALATLAAQADWTAQIPSPTNKVTRLRAGTRFGVALGLGSGLGEQSLQRVVWFAPDGKLVLDYQIPDGELQINLYEHGIYILNSHQILLVGSVTNTPGFRLLTVGDKGAITTHDYAFPAGLFRVGIDSWHDPIQPDTTGFYYVNETAQAVTRVDFPAPTASQNTKITLQSGSQPTGPWTDIADTMLPADKPSEFFRLRASKP